MRAATTCLDCGTLTARGTYCSACYADSPDAYRSTARWRRLSREQVQRHPVCVYCGSSRDLTTDHVLPLQRRGASHPSNLQTLCRSCNGRKADR